MKKIIKTALLLSASVLAMFSAPSMAADPRVAIVPEPVSVNVGQGHFSVDAHTVIAVPGGNKELRSVAGIFSGYMATFFDGGLRVKEGAPHKRAINLSVNPSMEREEYKLKVMPSGIDIEGGSGAGVYYGLQSLRQLMTQKSGDAFLVQSMTVNDKPHFQYRGMMIDVVRHFMPVEELKTLIDMLAMHKINTLHWHLTDDQGWRIEIKSHPKLTEVGANRAGTLIGHGGRPPFKYDGIPHGGYYTHEDVREVLRYAADRFITVIPEIEMPGHASAALTAYPELGCTGGPYEVHGRWGVFDEVFCAGNDDVFRLLEDVLTEVIELFPSQYIHFGADECPKTEWKKCPKCQQRILDEGLTARDGHSAEEMLQSYFVKRMERWLNERGRRMIGWDEILEGGLSETATVMAWRGPRYGVAAAQMGNYVIMSPNSNCYLDYYQSRDTANEPFGIGNYIPVEKVYALDPYAGIDPEFHRFILGPQGNLWREYVKTLSHTQYMLLPRLAALAERGWNYQSSDFPRFVRNMESLRALYEIYGYNYAKHIFEGRK